MSQEAPPVRKNARGSITCKYAREWERIEYYKEHFKGSDDDTDDDETIDLSNEPDEEGESVF